MFPPQVEQYLAEWLGWDALVLVLGERYMAGLLHHQGVSDGGALPLPAGDTTTQHTPTLLGAVWYTCLLHTSHNTNISYRNNITP